ncbi:MAG: SpoIIE family protein phosphatase [Desulfobacteraceae bacterium]|jgi:sigma-B regulation protein RsbU (phosphoserine phosphatase)
MNMKTSRQGNGTTHDKRPSFRGIYFIGLAATTIGIGVIILLNAATPLEYMHCQLSGQDQIKMRDLHRQLRGIFNLAVLLLFSCPLLLLLIRKFSSPISQYFNFLRTGQGSEDLLEKARQRLINLPFILVPANLGLWILLPSLLYFAAFITGNIDWRTAVILVVRAIMVGFISAGIMSLWIESYARRRLTPFLFPQGRLTEVKGVARYSVSRRIRLHNRIGSLIPMAILVVTLMTLQWQLDSVSISARDYGSDILVFCLVLFIVFFITLSVLNKLLNRSIVGPVENIFSVVSKIKEGNLQTRVKVVSNDEIGVLGDAINEMTKGLIERERMQQSLDLAREVQQNLLPKSNLKVNGFDLAGKSVYCDETGGDYYDFISIGENDKQKIGVAIGDVSGHGIPSALLMATVRSSLRQRASLPGSIARIITDVNRQLVQDVEDSGQFMTMFFLALDLATRQLEWVRAGHDPAIFYDPRSDSFDELGGPGIALGVDVEWIYVDSKKTDFSSGQIIFLSTDGIWEARNKKGEMLGKEPILNVIRQNASSDAAQIIDAIFNILDKFIGEVKLEDDITSVIIKMQN